MSLTIKSALVSAVALFSDVAIASPAPVEGLRVRETSSHNAYPMMPLKFIGSPTPGGENVTLFGSPEDVYNQLVALNPNYENEDWPVTEPAIEKRAKDGIICNIGPTGTVSGVRDGSAYLKRIRGECVAGGRSCVRVTCNGGGGIILCNDNNGEIRPQCAYIATYADDVINRCQSGGRVNGQEFDTDRYNVIGGTC